MQDGEESRRRVASRAANSVQAQVLLVARSGHKVLHPGWPHLLATPPFRRCPFPIVLILQTDTTPPPPRPSAPIPSPSLQSPSLPSPSSLLACLPASLPPSPPSLPPCLPASPSPPLPSLPLPRLGAPPVGRAGSVGRLYALRSGRCARGSSRDRGVVARLGPRRCAARAKRPRRRWLRSARPSRPKPCGARGQQRGGSASSSSFIGGSRHHLPTRCCSVVRAASARWRPCRRRHRHTRHSSRRPR